MNKYIIGIICTVLCLVFVGCDSFLEATPEDKVADVNFWQSETDVIKFLTDTYATTFLVGQDPENIHFLEACSDNSYNLWSGWYTDVKLVANGTQDAYGSVPFNIWKWRYTTIRKCYQVLENIDKISNLDPKTVSRLEAETRFLLSYNYFILTTLFGDVPFVDKVMTVQESKEIARSPKSEIVAYILAELDKASAALLTENMEFGRASWGACETLKARIYLNNNEYEKVLETTNKLIGKYELNQVGETPYEDLFSGDAESSPEIILSVIRDKTAGSINTGHNGNQSFFLKAISGGDAFCAILPTGSLIDSYPMADGRLIHETGSSYNPRDPYKDRDPRFYQSIIYPTGNIYYLNSTTNSVEWTLYDPENSATIPDHQYNAAYPSATGYVWKKYADLTPHAMNQITDCTNDHIIMRYADVLLMKAEALAEVNGTASKNEIIDLVDMLRDRCKGGKVHRNNYNSKDELISLVRNERRIELANEGLRYFDILRWKVAEKSPVVDGMGLKGELYGAYMRLDGVGQTDRTVMIDGVPRRYVETRFFDPAKHYLQPIPQKEIDLNNSLTQNPNW